jgi:hypothetical protein
MFCSGLVQRDVGICPSHQTDVTVWPEQVWTVRRTRTQTCNITAPVSTHKLNGFQIKMYSVFNTVSEWFMVNSFSLNLNKTFHDIKVFRMHKYKICILISCKKKRESCRQLLRKLKILPLTSEYVLSLSLFVLNNRNQFTLNSEIHNINSRQFNTFHQPRYNLSKYQEGPQH